MWRVVTSTIAALALTSSAALAQQPCTTDASRVVAEVYRHSFERGVDPASQRWAQQLANGQLTVKELVRRVVTSQEYMQRFGQTESGEGQPYERAVARLYRHILSRQPEPLDPSGAAARPGSRRGRIYQLGRVQPQLRRLGRAWLRRSSVLWKWCSRRRVV